MKKWNKKMRSVAGSMILTWTLATTSILGIGANTAYADGQGTVTVSVLNVRSGPSTTSACIGTVKANQTVNILGSENGWYKIGYNDGTAYVSAQYVSTVPGSSDVVATSGTGRTNVSSLNVRTGAGTQYRSLGTINKGTQLTIVGSENGWYKVNVSINGAAATAYVKAEYVTLNSGASEQPSQSPQPENSTPDTPVTENASRGKVNVNALNVRSQNNTNSSVLGTITYGTAVTITGVAGDWYQVTTTVNGRSVSGFVFGKYITKTNDVATDVPTENTPSNGGQTTDQPSTSETTSQKGVVNNGPLNVRSSASMNGTIVDSLPKGTTVDVIGSENGWYKIKIQHMNQERIAYVSAAYVTLTENSNTGDQNNTENQDNANTSDDTYKAVDETVWATEGVYIRKGPGTSYATISVLAKNSSIRRIGIGSDGWSKVAFGVTEAYICSDFITTKNPNPAAESATGLAVVEYAKQFLGNPYVYGGNNLNTGVDCSGFTQQIYLKFGIQLNRVADDQRYNGISVALADAQPGDLVFYGDGGYASHVAICMGDGKVIHASTPSTGIIISNMNYRTPMQINRVLIK